MKKILAVLLFFIAGNASAQDNSPEVDRGIASVKQKKFAFSAETKFFSPNLNAKVKSNDFYSHHTEAPEFIFRYKNISLDYIRSHDALHFVKLKANKEIFSLMGTGLEWNVALNAMDWRGNATENFFGVLPSAGINFYMRIRPRLDIYTQFSGITLGRHGYFKDFESGIKYFPQKNFSISAGWRRIDFKLRRGDNSGNFSLSGLFTGIRYDF